ncbi:MAG: stage V sporulation protein AE [Oscillospiraceae bacterium]|nr:stage V sporulation protein AE [Oscillospiraceae bacterium]
MIYLNAFWVGGLICLIAQILIDKTKLTPARILVIYVVLGVTLTAFGIYEPIVKYAGAGATVPLTGFGYTMAKGVQEMIQKKGFLGVFCGGLAASAAGVSAAVFFGYLSAVFSKSSDKT